ncbi:thioredoxin family protein [Candidatus Microgenomates bacterium]|nr:thioredoxin family protein [Candidatus Microgenomates bacterium]
MIKVTLVRPEGCAHCVQVKGTLEKLKKDYPDLAVEDIDMLSSNGQELVQKYKIMASPGILINNEFFASGGATEEQLRKKFEQLK